MCSCTEPEAHGNHRVARTHCTSPTQIHDIYLIFIRQSALFSTPRSTVLVSILDYSPFACYCVTALCAGWGARGVVYRIVSITPCMWKIHASTNRPTRKPPDFMRVWPYDSMGRSDLVGRLSPYVRFRKRGTLKMEARKPGGILNIHLLPLVP